MIGVDEVGRGAWAGPLLVVAAKLKPNKRLPIGLKDSKELSKKKRIELFKTITEACYIGEGWISADIIDELGLSNSMKSACLLSLMSIKAKSNEKIILDGNVNYFANTSYKNVIVKPKADSEFPIVSAASIVAKVLRDALMKEYESEYKLYGFSTNVGYGTSKHKKALIEDGPTPIHRFSYRPVKASIK